MEFRIKRYESYTPYVMLNNYYTSSYMLDQMLAEVNSFIKSNPQEIVIVDIRND